MDDAFLRCEAEEVWDAVKIDPYILVKTVDGKEVLKPKAEWTDHDKEMVQYNSEVMHFLFYALRKIQLNKVQQCSIAHEIWRISHIKEHPK